MAFSHQLSDLLSTAKDHHRAGRLLDAERIYRFICAASEHPEALHRLGVVAHRLGRQDAISIIERALRANPLSSEVNNDKGIILASRGEITQSIICFKKSVSIAPSFYEARNNLAHSLLAEGKLDEAIVELRHLAKQLPENIPVLLNLASALGQNEAFEEAIEVYNSVLKTKPDLSDAHVALTALHQRLGHPDRALQHAEAAIALAPDVAGLHNNLGNVHRAARRLPEAIAAYRKASDIDPTLYMAHYNRGLTFRALGYFPGAQDAFANAAADKRFTAAAFGHCMALLQPIYASADDIDEGRADYEQALEALAFSFSTHDDLGMLAGIIGDHQPYYLPYQGRNDVRLQKTYGAIVTDILSQRYGRAALDAAPVKNRPLRVGFVSGFFRRHSNWRMPIKGWLTQLDPRRYSIYSYHTASECDDETAIATSHSARFIQGPLPLDEWRSLILADKIDVLIYPELGMDKTAIQLAGQRLAPVQCCSWGHPVTSGMSTIDYFLSSDLMEPDNAEAHYSEKLIRLPNLSIYLEAPERIDAAHPSSEHHPSDAVVFWCAQALPKYLPDYDDVFPRIAKELPKSQFLFIAFPDSDLLTDKFSERLRSAFARHGLRSSDHCVMLPRLSPSEFTARMGAADVMLDSVGWSGCNSTLEAIARDLPVVTLWGEFMRGRHSAALLKMIGVEQTIGADVEGYVSIAVSLGRDPVFRKTVVDLIGKNKDRLYRDKACIRGLEDFLTRARQVAAPT